MRIDVLTLFPEIVNSIKRSIVKRSIDNGLLSIETHQLKNYSKLRNDMVDDKAYGGIDGMVMRPEPIDNALGALIDKDDVHTVSTAVVIPAANGYQLKQQHLEELSSYKRIVFISGRYSGIDHRIVEHMVFCLNIKTFELSIGPYVLLDGDIPVMVMINGIVRLIDGTLHNSLSAKEDSYSPKIHKRLLEYPIYTRPHLWHGHRVPDVLRGGNAKMIEDWKRRESIHRTLKYQPELLLNSETSYSF